MSRKQLQPARRRRREFTEEFKQEAVQMLLDGHTAPSVAERMEIPYVFAAYCAIAGLIFLAISVF